MAVFRNPNKELPYDPGIPLLGLDPKNWKQGLEEHHVHRSIIHNSEKVETIQVSIDGLIDKVWYIHIMEYCTTLKRKEILTHAVWWMNVEDIRLTDVSSHKKANSVWFHSCEVPRGVSRERKQKGGTQGLRAGEKEELHFNKHGVSVFQDEFWGSMLVLDSTQT